MSKPAIVLACDFSDRFKHLLAQKYEIIGPVEGSDPQHLSSEALKPRVLLSKGGLKTNMAFIQAMPELELISFFGTGFEGIDVATIAKRNLIVTNSPGANASSVADFAMGLIIASTRQIVQADRFVREGKWAGSGLVSMPAVSGLTGAKLGLYGFGAIGRKIASRAAGFELEIGYHNRSIKSDVPYQYFDDLISLAEWADILVVAVRADASNHHAVNADVLKALGSNGHLVNISRGIAVDTQALIECLENGTIAGAALDVFENEPHVPEQLKALPNTILSPHLAYASISAREAQEDMVLANLERFFANQPVLTPVDFS